MELFVVTDEDNLYGDRVGSLVYEKGNYIMLDIGNDKVIFLKTEVERII